MMKMEHLFPFLLMLIFLLLLVVVSENMVPASSHLSLKFLYYLCLVYRYFIFYSFNSLFSWTKDVNAWQVSEWTSTSTEHLSQMDPFLEHFLTVSLWCCNSLDKTWSSRTECWMVSISYRMMTVLLSLLFSKQRGCINDCFQCRTIIMTHKKMIISITCFNGKERDFQQKVL